MPTVKGTKTVGSRARDGIRDDRQRLGDHPTDTRALLNNARSSKSSFDYELLSMFVNNELAAQWTILLLALIFSLASMFWAPYEQAIAWLIIVVAAKVLLLEVCRRFNATPQEEIDLPVWQRRLFIAEAVGGMAWAGFALVGVAGNGEATEEAIFSSHVFLFASLIVVLAIRMTFASTVLTILYVGTIPMTVAVVARLAMLEDFFYLALASMAVGVHIYFVFLAKGLQTTAQAMLDFRAQKDLLIAELADAKSVSDIARQRAEEANHAKSRFLATMSHELRTPLNAILGFSEVMSNEILGPLENSTYKEYTGNIHSSGTHLLNLINEILDLSRIEAGKYELNEQSMQLCDTLDDCHRLMRMRAENKGIHLVEDFPDKLPAVWADERAIRQICLNLITNAIKFTPTGGEVVVSAYATDHGNQVIRVRDTGPGIPEHEIPKVLSAFGQGSLAHKTAEGGTGLGLPIVTKLIELHGGTFELKSKLRVGTEAIITIPAKRVMNPLPPLQPLDPTETPKPRAAFAKSKPKRKQPAYERAPNDGVARPQRPPRLLVPARSRSPLTAQA